MRSVKAINKAILLIIGVLAQTCNAKIYESVVSVKFSLYAANPLELSLNKMFDLEDGISKFISSEVRSSSTFANQELYAATFQAKEQSIDVNDYTVLGEMSFIYGGTKQDNFAASLSKVVTNDVAENLLETLIQNGYFGKSSTLPKFNFQGIKTSTILSTTNNEILFICLIALVGVLIMTSFAILLSSVNCCRRKIHYEDHVIKPSNTMETAINSPRNSPGQLGARKNIVPDDTDSAYAITPVRAEVRDPHSETPESQLSYRTEATNASRNPLGIMRLNTLNKVSLEPEKGKETKSMYQITLHESDDE